MVNAPLWEAITIIMSVHLTGVTLRFTPAGDFAVMSETDLTGQMIYG